MLRDFLAHPDVTERCELRGCFGLMAVHGGNLERVTDVVAREVADRIGASLYTVSQRAPLRRHLKSTLFDPEHSPALAGFLRHVDAAVSLHGYGHREGLRHHLLVGGSNRALARRVATGLRERLPSRYPVVDDLERIPRDLRGLHRRNPVNRPRRAGVQIELPPSIRWNRREAGWSDWGGVSRAPDVDRLIEALCEILASGSQRSPSPRPSGTLPEPAVEDL